MAFWSFWGQRSGTGSGSGSGSHSESMSEVSSEIWWVQLASTSTSAPPPASTAVRSGSVWLSTMDSLFRPRPLALFALFAPAVRPVEDEEGPVVLLVWVRVWLVEVEGSLPAGCVCVCVWVCVGGCGRGKSSSSIEGKDNDALRGGSWIGIELVVVTVLESFWATMPVAAVAVTGTGVSQHSSEGGEISEKWSEAKGRKLKNREVKSRAEQRRAMVSKEYRTESYLYEEIKLR